MAAKAGGMELYKIVLLGNSGVGKSNLLSRMNNNEFSEEFLSTIGVEFLTKVMEVEGEKVKAQIWDTAGQERYASMLGTYYKKAKGALLVYDVSDRASFNGIERWRSQLQQHSDPDVVMVLVGNKADLSKRAVTTEEGRAFAQSNGMLFIETSAKSGSNVKESFDMLIAGVHNKFKSSGAPSAAAAAQQQGFSLSAQQQAAKKEEESSCC